MSEEKNIHMSFYDGYEIRADKFLCVNDKKEAISIVRDFFKEPEEPRKIKMDDKLWRIIGEKGSSSIQENFLYSYLSNLMERVEYLEKKLEGK